MLDKLDSLIAAIKAAKKLFRKQAEESFKEVAKELFVLAPEVKTIRWCQFTPYFNDGEECVFSVSEPYFSNADPDQLSSEGELREEYPSMFSVAPYSLHDTKVMSDESAAACMNFSAIVQSAEMDEVMRDIFGDHVAVTVTPNSMDSDEYRHD